MSDPGKIDRRFRTPAWIKPWILPIWNAGVPWLREVGDRARAIAHRTVERCVVCGRLGLMIDRPRVIAPELAQRWGLSDRLVRAFVRKESSTCSSCGAKLRGRRLARVLLDLDQNNRGGVVVRSLAQWVETREANQLRIAEINVIDGVHDQLIRLGRFAGSDYIEGALPGSIVAGLRHEDLTRLTYPDEAFDLVISSETLEHVPDLAAALREIHRVLAPGGRHVFTIPMVPGIDSTFPRARLTNDGLSVPLAPERFPPGGNVGYRVCTEFGADFPDIVRDAGFEVAIYFGPITEDDVAQVYVARKPARTETTPR